MFSTLKVMKVGGNFSHHWWLCFSWKRWIDVEYHLSQLQGCKVLSPRQKILGVRVELQIRTNYKLAWALGLSYSNIVSLFIIYTLHQILLGWSNYEEWSRQWLYHPYIYYFTPRTWREDLGVCGTVIWRWIVNRVRGYLLNSCGSRYGSVGGSCEHGNESLESIKSKEFLD
jgi:hypothetical protein